MIRQVSRQTIIAVAVVAGIALVYFAVVAATGPVFRGAIDPSLVIHQPPVSERGRATAHADSSGQAVGEPDSVTHRVAAGSPTAGR